MVYRRFQPLFLLWKDTWFFRNGGKDDDRLRLDYSRVVLYPGQKSGKARSVFRDHFYQIIKITGDVVAGGYFAFAFNQLGKSVAVFRCIKAKEDLSNQFFA